MTKVEEAPATENREKEDGNNKAVISYTCHTLRFNEVLYKTFDAICQQETLPSFDKR